MVAGFQGIDSVVCINKSEAHGHCRPAHSRDCFVRNGNLFTVHINVFNDTGALDNLLYRSITGSIHIAMLMCFSMKTGRKHDREGTK